MKLKSSTLVKMAAAAGGIGLASAGALNHFGAGDDVPLVPPSPTPQVEVQTAVPGGLVPAEHVVLANQPDVCPAPMAVKDPCPACGRG